MVSIGGELTKSFNWLKSNGADRICDRRTDNSGKM